MFNPHHSSSIDHNSLGADRHTSPTFSHEPHNVWYHTDINPFRKSDTASNASSNYSNFPQGKMVKPFLFDTHPQKFDMDEIINALSNNKWLRYALFFALGLAAFALCF
jgi:hypothetical protein